MCIMFISIIDFVWWLAQTMVLLTWSLWFFGLFIILLIDNRQEKRGVIWRLVFNSIHQRSTFLIIFMQMKWHKLVLNVVNTFKNSINWIQQSTQFGFLLFCWQLHWVQRTVLLFAQPRGPVRTKKNSPAIDRMYQFALFMHTYFRSINYRHWS